MGRIITISRKGCSIVLVLALLFSIHVFFPQTASAAALFSDDFNDGNANGWTATSGTWGIITDGSPAYKQSGTSEGRTSAGSSSWKDYMYRLKSSSTRSMRETVFIWLLVM